MERVVAHKIHCLEEISGGGGGGPMHICESDDPTCPDAAHHRLRMPRPPQCGGTRGSSQAYNHTHG